MKVLKFFLNTVYNKKLIFPGWISYLFTFSLVYAKTSTDTLSLFLEFCNGWLCFWSSIMFIGVLTAIIGDVSSHLGCTVGLKDAVTAICFVAMGTSLPGEWGCHVEYSRPNTNREFAEWISNQRLSCRISRNRLSVYQILEKYMFTLFLYSFV